MRYALKFIILCDSPWGTLQDQVADELTHVRSNAYNSIYYSQYCVQHYIILNEKLQHLTQWKKTIDQEMVFN